MFTSVRQQIGQATSRCAAACQALPGRRTLVVVLLTVLILCSVWLGLRHRPEYVLVIDSGSSGTRIFAYQWKDNGPKLPTLTAVRIQAAKHKIPRRAAGDRRAYERLETEPGLDKFVADPEGLEKRALRPLLEWAEAVVPRRQWHRTPLFLFGTAGLRKLPVEGRAALLDDIRAALSRCDFKFEPSYANVISGEEEGVYGWIAVNYLNGHLAPSAKPAPIVVEGREGAFREEAASAESVAAAGSAADLGVETVGTLDLGGSSLEVTFLPTGEQASEATTNVSIMGVQYPLYTHVHHGYGLNDAFDKSVTLLLESSAANPKPPGQQQQRRRQRPDRGAPSREPPLTAGEEREGPKPPDYNRNPAANKSFQSRDDGGGRAPRGLLQAEDTASFGMDDATSFGGFSWQQHSGGGLGSDGGGRMWRNLLGVENVGGGRLARQESSKARGSAAREWLARIGAAPARGEAPSEQEPLHAGSSPYFEADGRVDARTGVGGMDGELLDTGRREEVARLGGGGQMVVRRRRLTEPHVVEHPCLHKGYSSTYRRMVSHGELPHPAMVQLVGRPDYEACAAVAESVLSTKDCGAANCVLGTAQPQSSGDFFALTGFFVVFHFFGLPAGASLAALEREGREHCGLDWDHLRLSRGAEIHVDQYCFRVPYIIALLRKGLAIPEARVRIGGGNEGWTLGAALAEGGRVGIGRPLIDKEQADYKQFVYFFGLAAAAMCIFVLVWKLGSNALSKVSKAASLTLGQRKDSLDIPEAPLQTGHLPPPGFPVGRIPNGHSQKPSKTPSPPGPFAPVPVGLQRPVGGVAAPVRAGGPQMANYYNNLSLNSSRKRQPSIDNLRGLDVPS